MCEGPEAGGTEINVKDPKKASVATARKHMENPLGKRVRLETLTATRSNSLF